jgi:hypothetical protein
MPATPLHQFPHLHAAVSETGAPGPWRWRARGILSELRDLLATESPVAVDGWLAARGAGVLRERNQLLARVAALGPQVLADPPVEDLRDRMLRLLVDVEHHLQRRRDLAWDEVELELGGSE